MKDKHVRRSRPITRALALTALTLVLTGCILRFFSGLVVVDDLGQFIDLIFADVNAAYCTDVRDFETGTTNIECRYNIVTDDGFSERTSTATLLSEFGVFGIIVDPVIVQVPETATIGVATVDDGSGPQDLVITETTAFDVTPGTQAVAETGRKFWIIDLPAAIADNLPDGPLQNAPPLDYRFSYRLPGVFSNDPVVLKAMFAGRVDAGGQSYYFPMFPCTNDFADVPEVSLPVGVPLDGFIFNLLFLFLQGEQLVCNDQVYDFGDVPVGDPPEVRLLKQVSLDGVNYFDADQPGDADVPVGVVGATDAVYRLIVQNLGAQSLTNVIVDDAGLGISAPIPDLQPGETRVIEGNVAGFVNLFQPRRCDGQPGLKSNVASVTASGAAGGSAADSDAAHLRCELPQAMTCDADANGQIDVNDVRMILAARGQTVPPADPVLDADGDGQISVLDARRCVLMCTNPRCATRAR